jgi:DNA-3-methyladenine glycosylase II
MAPPLWPAAPAHLARVDPRFAPLVRTVGPPAVELERNRFRALAESILYQQVAGSAARAIVGRVRQHYGGRFPTPAMVAATSIEDLRACGVSPQKARYLRALGEAFEEGRIPARRLPSMEDEAVIEALTEVVGIGRWTAEMFLIFSLGRPDVWPVGDYGVQKGVQRLLGQKALPARSRMARVAEPWRPYRSAAAWYMWRSLDVPTQGRA